MISLNSILSIRIINELMIRDWVVRESDSSSGFKLGALLNRNKDGNSKRGSSLEERMSILSKKTKMTNITQ